MVGFFVYPEGKMDGWKTIAEMVAEYEANIAVMQEQVGALIYRADQCESMNEAFNLRRQANSLSDAIGSSQDAVRHMRAYLHG